MYFEVNAPSTALEYTEYSFSGVGSEEREQKDDLSGARGRKAWQVTHVVFKL